MPIYFLNTADTSLNLFGIQSFIKQIFIWLGISGKLFDGLNMSTTCKNKLKIRMIYYTTFWWQLINSIQQLKDKSEECILFVITFEMLNFLIIIIE